MWFGSAQWFYNLATWLHDLVDALWMIGNDIDTRNGVIPPSPHAPPCSRPQDPISGPVFDGQEYPKLTPVQDTAESVQSDREPEAPKGTRKAYPWNR
jgi:hypothetical protein